MLGEDLVSICCSYGSFRVMRDLSLYVVWAVRLGSALLPDDALYYFIYCKLVMRVLILLWDFGDVKCIYIYSKMRLK